MLHTKFGIADKVWYRKFSRIGNIVIAIIEKCISFRDRNALNLNPNLVDNIS